MGFEVQIDKLRALKAAIEREAPSDGRGKLVHPYRGWVQTLADQIAKAEEWALWAAEQKGKKGGEKVGDSGG